ncbi:glycosyltransferase family 2 protein [Streptomyces sp. NPDC054826]
MVAEQPVRTVPDVSVIVAVYNTMPYLTDCLDSLVGQSIGLDRLEIVAVNDGSTDDSGAELDRFAAQYPGSVKVIHQKNSGGPAAPSNRALDIATGRYVYFVGSDDHLGTEALERMVAYADEHGSDVVVGRMEGTNGRYVHQALYKKNAEDVGFVGSALPWTLANTKLFRRDLVEQYKIRFPEHLPVGSDQPFTIEACVRAGKISVLADYTCYYAVKRGDASNITYRADHLARLRCTAEIMEFTAGLLEPGPERDAVLRRHFTWELAKLLQGDFPALDAGLQRDICAGVARLADAYFTDGIRDAMDVKRRVRICLARVGAIEELCEAIVREQQHGAPPFVLDGDRAYARYPGFRDPRYGLSDRCFEVIREAVPGRLAQGTELLASAWEQEGEGIDYTASVRVPVLGDVEGAVVRLVHGAMPQKADKPGARKLPAGHVLPEPVGSLVREPSEDGTATVLHARIPMEPRRVKLGVRVYLDVAGATYEIPVRGKGKPMPLSRRWGGPVNPHRATAMVNDKGRVVVSTAPLVPPKKPLTSRLKATVVRGLKRK